MHSGRTGNSQPSMSFRVGLFSVAQAFGAKGFRTATVRGAAESVLTSLKGLKDRPALVEVTIPEKDLAPQLARLVETAPQLHKYNRPSVNI